MHARVKLLMVFVLNRSLWSCFLTGSIWFEGKWAEELGGLVGSGVSSCLVRFGLSSVVPVMQWLIP